MRRNAVRRIATTEEGGELRMAESLALDFMRQKGMILALEFLRANGVLP